MLNKIIISIALLGLPHAAFAADALSSIAHDFPGWAVYQKATGDLNGDGIADTAAVLTKQTGDDVLSRSRYLFGPNAEHQGAKSHLRRLWRSPSRDGSTIR